MRGRLGVMIGFGAGYVLGAKAGTQRYEQLRRLYDNLMATSTMQQATGKAKDAVGAGLHEAKEAASSGVSKVTSAVKEKRSSASDGSSGLSVAPPPDYSR